MTLADNWVGLLNASRVEVNAPGYRRQPIWYTSGGDQRNKETITFPTAKVSWGEVKYLGFYNDPTGGSMVGEATIASPVTISVNDILQIPERAVIKSTDGQFYVYGVHETGKTIRHTNPLGSQTIAGSLPIAAIGRRSIAKDSLGHIYMVLADGSSAFKVYYSVDDGLTFAALGAGSDATRTEGLRSTIASTMTFGAMRGAFLSAGVTRVGDDVWLISGRGGIRIFNLTKGGTVTTVYNISTSSYLHVFDMYEGIASPSTFTILAVTGGAEIRRFTSSTSGTTWVTSQIITLPMGSSTGSGITELVRDYKGNIYMTWLQNGTTRVAVIPDGGSFPSPITAHEIPDNIVRIVPDGENLHILHGTSYSLSSIASGVSGMVLKQTGLAMNGIVTRSDSDAGNIIVTISNGTNSSALFKSSNADGFAGLPGPNGIYDFVPVNNAPHTHILLTYQSGYVYAARVNIVTRDVPVVAMRTPRPSDYLNPSVALISSRLGRTQVTLTMAYKALTTGDVEIYLTGRNSEYSTTPNYTIPSTQIVPSVKGEWSYFTVQIDELPEDLRVESAIRMKVRMWDPALNGTWGPFTYSSFKVVGDSDDTLIDIQNHPDDTHVIPHEFPPTIIGYINSLRRSAYLPEYTFTPSTFTRLKEPIRADTVVQMRNAIAQLYSEMGLSAPTWTDPVIAKGTMRKGIHWKELMNRLYDI